MSNELSLFRDVGEFATTTPRIRLAKPELGDEELRAVQKVFRSGRLTGGPMTEEFEVAFAARHHVEHAVAFASGTVALDALYLALGIGSGDEVIVPSMTFISTVTSVLHVGATPVFADIEPSTLTLDPVDVYTKTTPRTRAIVAVHYGGQPAHLDELSRVASSVGAVLLEDAAEAHGATYKNHPVGGLARAAMFSFTPTKNITTGEGGMVTTNDGELARHLRLLRNHGQVAPYDHAFVGSNWRMTEIQAAIGTVQLGKLDGILARKQHNARLMHERLSGIPGVILPTTLADRTHTYMLYTLQISHERDLLLHRMNDLGIEARIYFPPAHLQQAVRRLHLPRPSVPTTEEVARRIMSVPFHASLTGEELNEVIECITDFMSG